MSKTAHGRSEERHWHVRVAAHRTRRRVWRSTSPSPIAPVTRHVSAAANSHSWPVIDKLGRPLPGAVVDRSRRPARRDDVATNDEGNSSYRARRGHGRRSAPAGTVSRPRRKTAAGHPTTGAGSGCLLARVARAADRSRTRDYTLAVTVDLATALDSQESPDTPVRRVPGYARVAQLSGRGQGDVAAGVLLRPLRGCRESHAPLARPVRVLRLGKLRRVRDGRRLHAGLYEDFPGFRYLEIGGTPTNGARDRQWVVDLDPLRGAIRTVELKSARGVNDDCSQVPAEQILEHHCACPTTLTLVFTPR